MYFRILHVLFIFTLLSCGMNVFGQGKVSGPTQQSQTSKPKKSTPKVTVSEPDGYSNGHGYVDLGLPSGTKWATCNVGAKSPEEYGDYFAWGETKPYSPKSNKCKSEGKKISILESEGVINTNELTPSYDAARLNFGDMWRLPNMKEIKELITECEWIWMGKGYKVIGPNRNSIFITAAGEIYNKYFRDVGRVCVFWSSTVHGKYWAYNFHANPTNKDKQYGPNIYNYGRDICIPVRAVF